MTIDTLSRDKSTEDAYYPVHEIFLPATIFIIENVVNLDKLNEHLYAICVEPLNIISTESSIRLFAVI